MITGDKQVRVFAVLATVTGFAEVIAVASVPGSRYDALPVMLLDAMVIIAVDAFVRRRSAVTLTPLPPASARVTGRTPCTAG
jgi:hypothetical protein